MHVHTHGDTTTTTMIPIDREITEEVQASAPLGIDKILDNNVCFEISYFI